MQTVWSSREAMTYTQTRWIRAAVLLTHLLAHPSARQLSLGELSFPIGKVGLERTKQHLQKQTCQHVTQFFGLSCKVFKRTEYRECVLIGNCH